MIAHRMITSSNETMIKHNLKRDFLFYQMRLMHMMFLKGFHSNFVFGRTKLKSIIP